MTDWIIWILIGGVAGWVAERTMKFETGLVMNVVLGVLGAIIGNFILNNLLGYTLGGFLGQIAVAAAGACLLIYLYRAIKGQRA